MSPYIRHMKITALLLPRKLEVIKFLMFLFSPMNVWFSWVCKERQIIQSKYKERQIIQSKA